MADQNERELAASINALETTGTICIKTVLEAISLTEQQECRSAKQKIKADFESGEQS